MNTGQEIVAVPQTEQVMTAVTRLRQMYPDAHCELNYETPIQLLAATILSAQCTDERVNQVTPLLFARFPDAPALAAADRTELEEIIRPTGFFRQKAKFIQESAQTIVHAYGGEVPPRMEELLRLKGVARKTANVVLGEIYGRAEGITVDTHVKRIAHRLGWTTTNDDPVKVEQELMGIIPKENWIEISHLLIFHGRALCKARRPVCAPCLLRDICPSVEE